MSDKITGHEFEILLTYDDKHRLVSVNTEILSLAKLGKPYYETTNLVDMDVHRIKIGAENSREIIVKSSILDEFWDHHLKSSGLDPEDHDVAKIEQWIHSRLNDPTVTSITFSPDCSLVTDGDAFWFDT
ncbi:hypothetical protein EVB94_145 [Rhizobium phage RHph_TM40]|uniref:Uncharacterized protein n=1 Tax=Rhizobium phage RHph_TM30 TaxID=2509764 RepID=A0A7S5UVE4_9CAUD|nr:hypothetical protein PQC16_gp146 [Rhizobium phage RHph_TM30]QIG71253.1 hypothetical protein EVB93_146 [Rhizobium phage RHph_TM30]QIG71616.1 hypothetical protein EVB94_145 [Rhizobium phage RHph_TM40]QIG71979.1 hypothetical protein EVB95_145 [Rhizobium phage RHph_TM2_3B]QIG72341.1 hypothetical protein EVB96_145 [Rhizobium phage RHph_TM3_3_6]